MLQDEVDDPVMRVDNPTSCSTEKRRKGLLPKNLASYDLQCSASDIPSWQCEVCHLQVSSKESLRRHVLACHIKQRVHDCHLCTTSFVLKFQLLQHLRVSHPIDPDSNTHPCICGRVFSRRNSLLCHIKRVHHPAPLQRPTCTLCGKAFNDKAALRTHHAQVHAPASLLCPHPGCGKLFRTPGLRNAHNRYHMGSQFCCNICDKPFSTGSYRDKHQLTHSGVRQYVCGECGVACITASQLGTHTRRRHGARQQSTRLPPPPQLPTTEASISGAVVGVGLDAFEVQDVDDPEPIHMLLESTQEDAQFLDQNDVASPDSVHTQSTPNSHKALSGNSPDDSHLVQSFSDFISYAETEVSFHNLLVLPKPSDHSSPSACSLRDDNFFSDHNSLDHNFFNDHYSFDDKSIDDYNS